jgi:beta-1,4-mannooligosaccharide/beta-1,4-mannosyl-N-acetylglucosamine phosphorylase
MVNPLYQRLPFSTHFDCSHIHRGFSENGIDWELEDAPIQWQYADKELSLFEHRYDPRVVWLEDRYYVTWCNGYHGPTIGIGYTFDF